MDIGCVYTIELPATTERPLRSAQEISFGIATIATLLKREGHNVELLVLTPFSPYRAILDDYVRSQQPRLFCFTAVSTQFRFVRELASHLKRIDNSIFIALGGHHASLDPDGAIQAPEFDAICVGEGDRAVVELADRLARGESVSGIPGLWVMRADETVQRNAPPPLCQNLDALPNIDRSMWDRWIVEPERCPSILLGRGCPFRCAYCSNHAMQRISPGRYVRMRTPERIVEEIREICASYPAVDELYLEVETLAHQKQALPLLRALEIFNAGRERPICFGLNFTVTSQGTSDDAQTRSFLEHLRRANVAYLNIGIESGSEQLRRDVLRRPDYSNEALFQFARLCRQFGIQVNLYVLIGFPGETLADYRETLKIIREVQPQLAFPSIYYPYPGTDLCRTAIDQGLITLADRPPSVERSMPVLDLPGFPRWRIRLEFPLFWWRAFGGRWSASRVIFETILSIVKTSPRLWRVHLFLQERLSVLETLRSRYHRRMRDYEPEGIDRTDGPRQPGRTEAPRALNGLVGAPSADHCRNRPDEDAQI
jgi:radical SAM superfamily enzyme YgiQ (UPF0313 family)